MAQRRKKTNKIYRSPNNQNHAAIKKPGMGSLARFSLMCPCLGLGGRSVARSVGRPATPERYRCAIPANGGRKRRHPCVGDTDKPTMRKRAKDMPNKSG